MKSCTCRPVYIFAYKSMVLYCTSFDKIYMHTVVLVQVVYLGVQTLKCNCFSFEAWVLYIGYMWNP